MVDATIKNLAPDSDVIIISVGDWNIEVSRDDFGRVIVEIDDTCEGTSVTAILGEPGTSQRI